MPVSNRELLEHLLSTGRAAIDQSAIFDRSAEPLFSRTRFDRVEGMLLGLAIGDALGAVSEGMRPESRRARFGEIRDYPPNPRAGGRPVGTPTDDSQLAFYTIEHLLDRDRLEPAALGKKFAHEPIFGIGGTVSTALRNIRRGVPWHEAGPRSAGNGALMRIAPVLLPHLRKGGKELYADAALAAMLTHNDPASTAACVAFIAMLWELLAMSRPPEQGWWVATYLEVAQSLENASDYKARQPSAPAHHGRICDYVAGQVPAALREGLSVEAACNRWGSGAYLLETLPSVLYILSLHGLEPEEAIVRAVNDTRDNDTCGAIVGAAVGALHGAAALPRPWKENLMGWLRGDDDGRIFELIALSRERWWSQDDNAHRQ
ncbi:MAG: ADP-ribosylglycohydrolase family protein [Anaerolineales bacterium]